MTFAQEDDRLDRRNRLLDKWLQTMGQTQKNIRLPSRMLAEFERSLQELNSITDLKDQDALQAAILMFVRAEPQDRVEWIRKARSYLLDSYVDKAERGLDPNKPDELDKLAAALEQPRNGGSVTPPPPLTAANGEGAVGNAKDHAEVRKPAPPKTRSGKRATS